MASCERIENYGDDSKRVYVFTNQTLLPINIDFLNMLEMN
jgi:hypothetical protein